MHMLHYSGLFPNKVPPEVCRQLHKRNRPSFETLKVSPEKLGTMCHCISCINTIH